MRHQRRDFPAPGKQLQTPRPTGQTPLGPVVDLPGNGWDKGLHVGAVGP